MKKKLIILITLFFMFILNVDALQSVWDITISGNDDDYINSFVDTKEGYVIIGSSYSTDLVGITNKGETDAIISKYDKNRDLVWQKNYGGSGSEYFHSIISLSNGYLVLGSSSSQEITGKDNLDDRDSIIVKYDLNGNVAWEKSWGGTDVDSFDKSINVSDGYVVVGGSFSTDIEGLTNKGGEDGIIIKYDLSGNIAWQKNYGGESDDHFSSIISLSDGFIVVGYSSSANISGLTNKGNEDGIIIKYDLNGDMVWQKNYGGSDYDDILNLIEISSGFVVVGETCSTDIEGIDEDGTCSAIIAKYDSNGDIVLQKNYIDINDDNFFYILENDDGYSVLGSTVIVKYDKNLNVIKEISLDNENLELGVYKLSIVNNGYLISWTEYTESKDEDSKFAYFKEDLLWQRNYGGLYHDYFNDVTAIDNGYLAVGMYGNMSMDGSIANNINNNVKGTNNPYDASLVKYDLDGNIVFQRKLDGNGGDYYNSIAKTSDGSIVVGSSNSTNLIGITNKGENDGIIVKYDINGSVIWQKNWGGNNNDYFNSIEAVSDGYIVAGYTSSTDINDIENTDGYDIGVIIKFDLNGNVVWQKKSSISTTNTKYNDVKALTDGYIVVGRQSSPSVAIIIKYDLEGNVVWQKTYTNTTSSNFNSVTIDSNEYVVVGSNTTLSRTGYLIVKYDSTGNIVWEKYNTTIDNSEYSSVDTTTDGYYTTFNCAGSNLYTQLGRINTKNNSYLKNADIKDKTFGSTHNSSFLYSYIDKYDKNGKLLWSKFYGGSGYTGFNSIDYSYGNYVVVGTSSTIDMVGLKADTEDDAIIVKYKSGFDVVTIANDDGSLVAVDSASEGEKVTITVTPNKGYTLKTLIVKDKDGNIIKVNEDNTFIMPAGDVTVEAIFTSSLRNPETWDLAGFKSLFLYLITIAGSIGLAFMIYISKKSIKL